jgi:hypothetical protein
MDCRHQEQAKKALENAEREQQMRRELAEAAAGVLADLPTTIPEIPEKLQSKTLSLAYFLARLRAYVPRDHKDAVRSAPDVEVPTRLTKQLLRLGRSVALVRHKGCLTPAEFAIMRKVALDSIPSTRRAILNELLNLKRRNLVAPYQYFAQQCRISWTPARVQLEDLMLLGLVEKVKDNNGKDAYQLKAETFQEWKTIAPGPSERH